jgi:bacterial/archaeal transporter family-2 protein
MVYFYVLIAFLAGVALPIQVAMNATLRKTLGSPILSSLVSFVVGTVTLTLYAVITRVPLPPLSTVMSEPPRWAWLGGIIGAFYVASAVVMAPKLGAATLVALVVTGQLISSILLDHFGLFGFAVHELNWQRALGIGLLIAGVLLIQRN